jgi:hypothetical protein
VSNSHHKIAECASDDVRLERVEQIRLILTSKAYAVAAQEVAAKVIDYMLDLGRANSIRKKHPPSKKTAARILTSPGVLVGKTRPHSGANHATDR